VKTPSDFRQTVGQLVLVCILVAVSAWLSIYITREGGRVAAVWLSNGVLLGLLLSVRASRWPAYLMAGYLGNLAAAIASGDTLATALSLCACNMVEIALAARLIRSGAVSGSGVDLSERNTLIRFTAFAVVLGPLVAAVLGSLILSGTLQADVVKTWFLADALGMAITAPITIIVAQERLRRSSGLRKVWTSGSMALLVLITVGIFLQTHYPLAFLIVPATLLVVFQHGQAGGAVAIAVVGVITVAATLMGHWRFALMTDASLPQKIYLLQLFIAVTSAQVLAVGALLAARERLQSQLQEREAQLRGVADNMPALVAQIDASQRYVFANAHLGQVFGIDPASMIGRTMREVRGEKVYADIQPYVERVLNGETLSFQNMAEVNGRSFHYQSNYAPYRDSDGKVGGFYAMTFDITALKQAESQLEQIARFDALTGLPNRREFESRFADARQLALRSGQAMALLFLDVDHFKAVNDSYGHGAGDLVLQTIANRLKTCVRASDCVARIAGDEFVAILNGLREQSEIQFVARKILSAMAQPISCNGEEIIVSVSIGAAFEKPGERDTNEPMMSIADRALYASKAAGRGTFRIAAA
jgi:diguanylate cyclase (GGDEF)-like protein/PAS domain S-box-containing protein